MSYLVAFPVSNIDLGVNSYQFGLLTLYKKNTYPLTKKWSVLSNPILEPLKSEFKGKVMAEIKDIEANDINEAIDKAIIEFGKAIDLLSIIYYQKQHRLIISEPNLEESFSTLVKDTVSGKTIISSKNLHFNNRFIIKKGDLSTLGKLSNHFYFLSKPFDQYSKLEKRISNSLYWCRKANMTMRKEERLASYVIALDSLLVNKDEWSKGNKIASRGSQLISLSQGQKKKIQKKLKRAYNLRNFIVHDAIILRDNESDFIESIRHYTYSILFNAAELAKKRRTLKGMISLSNKIMKDKRVKNIKKLKGIGVTINKLPKASGSRIKYYKGNGTLKKNSGSLVTNMDLSTVKFFDDGNYVYIVVRGRNYQNTHLNLISTDKLFVECQIGSLGKTLSFRKLEFKHDIVLTLPQKLQNNIPIDFISYEFEIE